MDYFCVDTVCIYSLNATVLLFGIKCNHLKYFTFVTLMTNYQVSFFAEFLSVLRSNWAIVSLVYIALILCLLTQLTFLPDELDTF